MTWELLGVEVLDLTILVRVAVTFAVLLVLTRITGKKQLSQSTFFDFITAITIGDIAGERLIDPELPILPWLAATVLWFLLVVVVDVAVMKSRPLAKLLEGEPAVLIENGKVMEKSLRENFVRVDDLLMYLRKKGHFNPADVEYAVFEIDGTVSVLPRSQLRPVYPRDLNIPTRYEGMVQELIIDGEIIHQNLRKLGLTEVWLMNELLKRGFGSEKQIVLATLDTQGDLFVDGYRDPVPPVSAAKNEYAGPH